MAVAKKKVAEKVYWIIEENSGDFDGPFTYEDALKSAKGWGRPLLLAKAEAILQTTAVTANLPIIKI